MDELQYFASGRGRGKTTKLVEWVRLGEEINKYPGWSRIIITPNENQAQWVRKEFNLDYHQVYSIQDYQPMPDVHKNNFQIGMDNAEWILEMYLHRMPNFITFTGSEWNE